jgi:hypothetical protein
MQYNNRQYPHPVLGLDDSVIGSFLCNLNVSSNGKTMIIAPSIVIKNDQINKLIELGKASMSIHIYCRATFFRNSYNVKDKISDKIEIHAEKLKGQVEVDFLICSNEEFKYSNEFHNDFGNLSFNIENGDIIGYGGKGVFYANKSPEKLKATSSIFQISSDSKKNTPAKLDFDSDKIIIYCSETDFEIYQNLYLNSQTVPIIHSCLIFPMLIQVINFLLSNEDSNQFKDKVWY